jgi:hypothetical protein
METLAANRRLLGRTALDEQLMQSCALRGDLCGSNP